MSENSNSLEFTYKKEFWYISTFVNSKNVNIGQSNKEIEAKIRDRITGITTGDLSRVRGPNAEEIKAIIVDMVKHASMQLQFITFIAGFPYVDENTENEYDTLGYLQIELEYYKESPEKKASITPLMIQQVPGIVLAMLQAHEKKDENRDINFDTESPIYIFVTSDKSKPEVSWSEENIKKYKRPLGNWIEIYSGAWHDYNEQIYDMRVENNLSNRLSELHFIKRNSGFIYMAEENYKAFFDGNMYMRQYVLDPTPRIRTILFALICINHSLDTLFMKRHTEFLDSDTIEKKLQNLRFLRGVLQTKLSVMYDELDYNRRQHYTAVLTHLIKEFGLDRIIARINDKFEIIYNTMQELYQKKTEENQEDTERGLKFLNLLFGLGVIANLGDNILRIFQAGGVTAESIIGFIVSSIISAILLVTILAFTRARIVAKKKGIARTVDAVILDGKGNVVLVKRDRPPFNGYYALPGRFIHVDEGETERVAMEKTLAEKVGGNVIIEKKQGTYGEVGRDPRGKILSIVFKCKLTSGDGMKAELIPIDKIKDMKLAFDHKKILKDVLKDKV